MSAEATEKLSYALPEVAELTGVTLRRLQDGCRAKQVPHTVYRGQRVMTPEHIARFLAANEIAPDTAPVEQAEVSRIEEHRRRVASRLARKAGRAA